MNNPHYEDYENFQKRRQHLRHIIGQAAQAYQRLSIPTREETLRQLEERVNSDTFKVLVLGEFKRGKSTLINALLGEEVLPSEATPCTAVINEIKWGETKRAVLHFRDPLPQSLPERLSEKIVTHITTASGNGRVPPIEVPVEELAHYVVIPDPTKDQAASVAESPYSKVEIFWPLELCKNGIEIIDSPGLNEHSIRTRVTIDYLANVDAILFVMMATNFPSSSEMRVIEQDLHGMGHEEIFFIINWFDIIRAREQEKVKAHGQMMLGDKTTLKPEGIFYISASKALDGKLDDDRQLLRESGFVDMETVLSHFLVSDRGRIKLLQPTRDLGTTLHEALLRDIPGQIQLMEMDLEKIEQKFAAIKPRLDDAQHQRQQIIRKIQSHQEKLRDEIRTKVNLRMYELARQVPSWIKGFEPQNKIQFKVLGTTAGQYRALSEEVAGHLFKRVEEEQLQWQKQELSKLIETSMESLACETDRNLKEFFGSLDQIKVDLTGVSLSDEDKSAGKEISAWEKVFAAGGGFLLAPGMALVGAREGFSGVVKSLVPQVGTAVGLVLLGVASFPVLFAGSIIVALIESKVRAGGQTKKAVEEVAKKFADRLREDAHRVSETSASEVIKEIGVIEQGMDNGLKNSIKEIQEQVEAVLEEKRHGTARANERKQILSSIGKQMQTLSNELLELTIDLGGSMKGMN